MFMRVLQIKIKPEIPFDDFRQFYNATVIGELQGLSGCLYAGLNQSGPHPDEYISMTFWDSQNSADEYERSGTYQRLMEKGKPYLAESTEWKIELSKQLELEYKPVAEEPILKEYSVAVQSDEAQAVVPVGAKLHVRIVSLKIEDDKIDEFKGLYAQEIMPALKQTAGCLHAYLTEDLRQKHDFISVTIWASKEDADRYEQSGRFDELVNKVKHTFTKLFQWKMALEKDYSRRVKTSDDLAVSHYKMVTGRRFH